MYIELGQERSRMRTRDASKNDERLMSQNTNDKLRDGSVIISPSGFGNRRSAFMFYEQVSMHAWSNWPNPPTKTLSDAWHKKVIGVSPRHALSQ